jgi:hypothetical protein
VATGETENNGGKSTVQIGDLYSVRMKLAHSEIAQPERVRESRDPYPEFERLKTLSRFIRQTSFKAVY